MSLTAKYDAQVGLVNAKRARANAQDGLSTYKTAMSQLLALIDGNTGGDFTAHDRAGVVDEINTTRSQLQQFLNNWPAAV